MYYIQKLPCKMGPNICSARVVSVFVRDLTWHLGGLYQPAEALESQRPCTCFALIGGATGVTIA